MELKELQKKQKEIEKKIAQIDAKAEVNLKELKALEKEIKDKTGLKDLSKLSDYMEKLSSELHRKRETLEESIVAVEAQLVEILDTESKGKSLEEELREI